MVFHQKNFNPVTEAAMDEDSVAPTPTEKENADGLAARLAFDTTVQKKAAEKKAAPASVASSVVSAMGEPLSYEEQDELNDIDIVEDADPIPRVTAAAAKAIAPVLTGVKAQKASIKNFVNWLESKTFAQLITTAVKKHVVLDKVTVKHMMECNASTVRTLALALDRSMKSYLKNMPADPKAGFHDAVSVNEAANAIAKAITLAHKVLPREKAFDTSKCDKMANAMADHVAATRIE